MINIKIKKKLDYIIFISLILIILLILMMIDIHSYYYKIPDVKWPFINLKDENNKNINMLCIRGILNDKEKLQFLDYINRGIKFIGCSSYLSFPKECENIHGDCHKDGIYKIEGKDIEEYVLGWCHCFRDPDKYIKHNIPRILISESDFNSDRIKIDPSIPIKYDYITIQPNDNDDKCNLTWNSHNKNWKLAEKCIQIFSDKLNLKGLIIGKDKCPINIEKKENIITTNFVEYWELMKKIQSCKFLLVPNYEDASPRIITESLALNKPIFVNENILGGWKYVNNKTGVFFNENNIEDQVLILLNNIEKNIYSPKKYLLDNYCDKNSGKQLKDFLKQINPELSECEYVKFPVS